MWRQANAGCEAWASRPGKPKKNKKKKNTKKQDRLTTLKEKMVLSKCHVISNKKQVFLLLLIKFVIFVFFQCFFVGFVFLVFLAGRPRPQHSFERCSAQLPALMLWRAPCHRYALIHLRAALEVSRLHGCPVIYTGQTRAPAKAFTKLVHLIEFSVLVGRNRCAGWWYFRKANSPKSNRQRFLSLCRGMLPPVLLRIHRMGFLVYPLSFMISPLLW